MQEIRQGKVVYTDVQGRDSEIHADTVVLALGSISEDSLATALKRSGVAVRVIGDAVKPGKVGSAIESGFDLALEV